MDLARVPLRIAQISDVHCGEISFDRKMMASTIERINAMAPDLVVVAGDLTAAGYEWEFQEAKRWIDQIEHPTTTTRATSATCTSRATSGSGSSTSGRPSPRNGPSA